MSSEEVDRPLRTKKFASCGFSKEGKVDLIECKLNFPLF